MDSYFIDKCLREKFISHKYQLSNSFVYNEESDFFSMTASGYAQEIEVKVSRSDFQADFKKTKHDYFAQIYSGREYVVKKGRVTSEVSEPIMINLTEDNGKTVFEEDKYGRKRPKKVPSGKYRESKWTGDTIEFLESGCRVRPLYTGIRIFKPVLPNKFWFCVPEGLIGKEEIPDYAGLMYVKDNGRTEDIKKAPFIHKNKHDLKQVLLDKFYYLSLRLQNSV